MQRKVTNRRVTRTNAPSAANRASRKGGSSNLRLWLAVGLGAVALYLLLADYNDSVALLDIQPTETRVKIPKEEPVNIPLNVEREEEKPKPLPPSRHMEDIPEDRVVERKVTPSSEAKKPEETPLETPIEQEKPKESSKENEASTEQDVPRERPVVEPEPSAKEMPPPEQIEKQPVQAEDQDCPFRDSPIYRKVYVYPNYGEVEHGWEGDMLSEYGKDLDKLPRWPYLDIDFQSRNESKAHYNTKSTCVQYTTELLVREIMINPNSCLRTYDPEEATLFYVPYLPSVEHHTGHDRKTDYSTTVYGQALMDIVDKGDHSGWEQHFGLTSKYWKRRGGADHILVFSEPMHGLWHPRSRRGNFHFIHSQKQLKPPIVISVELSTTFVEMYPKCAAKNILVPYPNTDGGWFNGLYQAEAMKMKEEAQLTSEVALPAERHDSTTGRRPIAQFYSAGHHGTCTKLRKAMTQDYRKCSPSFKALKADLGATHYVHGMHLSTFCPCPGGDSPSAKRHYDALIAECIPIILSYDFVWPFTNEFDPNIDLDPSEFSMKLLAKDFENPMLNETSCQPFTTEKPGLQKTLEDIPATEIERLREGMKQARELYTWYKFDPNLPENPLREGVLPDGGAAHQVVKMLAERAAGAMWPACEEELKLDRGKDPMKFKC